jgi:hypothetical protein
MPGAAVEVPFMMHASEIIVIRGRELDGRSERQDQVLAAIFC